MVSHCDCCSLPGMRHLDLLHGEAELLGQQVVDRDRLLAVGRAVVEHHDLLALQVVDPALARGQIVDDARGLAVRVEQQREDIGEDAAVGGIGAAVVDRDQRHLVGGDPVDHRVGDADAERVPGGDIGPGLQTLVAFDAALDLVLGLALVPDQLDAVDAAVTRVDQVHVVDEPAEEAGAAGGVGTDAVALQRKVLLVGLGSRDGGRQSQCRRQGEYLEQLGDGHRS